MLNVSDHVTLSIDHVTLLLDESRDLYSRFNYIALEF